MTSKPLEERWTQHIKASKYFSTYFYKALRLYGPDSFTLEILGEGLDAEERFWIEELKPEYNMTKGGDGGDTSKSPAFKEAMKRRDTSGSNNPMYGRRGINNPKYGKKYGPKPLISEAKKKVLKTNDDNIFHGFKEMWDYYNVKSYYSLKKLGITYEVL